MKKLIFSLAFGIIVHYGFNIENCLSQWVQLNAFPYSDAYSLTNKDANIFASNDYGVFFSSNNGNNWSLSGLANIWVPELTRDLTNIFAGTFNGVFISTNDGTSWIQTSLSGKTVVSFAVNGNTIFAGTWYYGVYKSTNSGGSWSQTTLNNTDIWSLGTNGNNIFAYSSNGVYLSTNNGQEWVQNTLNNFYSFATIGNNIFVGGRSYGVFLSTNNGQSWLQTSLNDKTVNSIAISGNNIFVGTDSNGVYLSTNNGQTWTQKNQGWNIIPSVQALLITNNYIFAGTSGYSVWRRSLTEIIGIQNISSEIPSAFSLEQNYPNPFNPTTNIKFQIVKSGIVKLTVFDMLGKEIATLVNENIQPGTYETTFDASQLTSGIYFYRMQTDSYTETKRMILVK